MPYAMSTGDTMKTKNREALRGPSIGDTMGYTHYFADLVTDEAFAKDVAAVVEAAEAHGIRICGPMGDGEPFVGADAISLNGDAEEGLDHETFYLPAEPDGFNFCKTARKPYDAVVVATLIRAIVTGQEGWEGIGSDGTWSDWVDARGGYGKKAPVGGVALYEEVFGKLSEEDVAKVKAKIGE